MSWILKETGFDKDRIAVNGNKFMIGNGSLGYRGTLEEFGKDQLAACTIAGLYDKVGDKWREPVNAPNGFHLRLYCDGAPLGPLEAEPVSHVQELRIREAVHGRSTVFAGPGGNLVTLASERFASADQLQLLAMKFSIQCTRDCSLVIETGIDGEVWDINGPHLENHESYISDDGILVLNAITHELKKPVSVAESLLHFNHGEQEIRQSGQAIHRRITLSCKAGAIYPFFKFVAVQTGEGTVDATDKAALTICTEALQEGYHAVFNKHRRKWEDRWQASDVRIEGDEEAQFALRYSIYQLLIIAPAESDKVSIPARGLSGQVYKGAVFWDTEMFMLPFFLHTHPEVARNLMMYRCRTLNGARRKAAEYGYEGAYYAWESQETGDDACTLFNITDVFTNRPMRTYFRDKQIHISADVACGIWQYYLFTSDDSIFLDGGAETILECARFYLSYAYYKPGKNRYELLDVTGPDEYHERVNNNAFTNYMVQMTLEIALKAAALLQEKYPSMYAELMAELDYKQTLEQIRRMHQELYVPEPDPATGLIEQFDGYFRLEDPGVKELKERMLHPNEYFGGGSGLAATTQVLKQADVVLMLHLFKGRFSDDVKRANWEYYEPRTEHGSSLSPCVYALVASDLGRAEWAYRYFMRTATIDLTGNSKQYVGDLYIGGTHPAANGGAWMAAILGFAGVRFDGDDMSIRPSLPAHWDSLAFRMRIRNQSFDIRIGKERISIRSNETSGADQIFAIEGERLVCAAGQSIEANFGMNVFEQEKRGF